MQAVGSTMNPNSKLQMNISVAGNVSPELLDEIIQALKSVGGYGSLEIYVQDHSVTQITVRKIRKTKFILAE